MCGEWIYTFLEYFTSVYPRLKCVFDLFLLRRRAVILSFYAHFVSPAFIFFIALYAFILMASKALCSRGFEVATQN